MLTVNDLDLSHFLVWLFKESSKETLEKLLSEPRKEEERKKVIDNHYYVTGVDYGVRNSDSTQGPILTIKVDAKGHLGHPGGEQGKELFSAGLKMDCFTFAWLVGEYNRHLNSNRYKV